MSTNDVNPLPPKVVLECESAPEEVKASHKRWYILGLFMMYAALSTFQWVEYSIIANIVMRYYDVSENTVAWTSMSFNLMWPILLFPTSLIIDKMVRIIVISFSSKFIITMKTSELTEMFMQVS
ncbi:hypothetical protein JTB14_033689 [Gonioctena quinquepunctata]|nr:hypothetical protein JTB14_033689 [Gonioctena quinquepunctata]